MDANRPFVKFTDFVCLSILYQCTYKIIVLVAWMAQQTLKNRLINFTPVQGQSQQMRNCYKQAYNSLMLSISELDLYEEIESFTQCEREDCKMVLTNQDKDYIDDWNWVFSNEQNYSDIKDKIQIMKTDKYNWYIWNCRFCATKNIIYKNNVYFAKNRNKVVIRDSVIKEGNRAISEAPLLLFLIDNSSSMEEEIIEQDKAKQNKEIMAFVNDVLKKTDIYQKISQNQKKILNQIKRKIEDAKPETYIDNLTKYRVLMSMTQRVTSEICSSKSRNQSYRSKSSVEKSQRKIGFMFFNSHVTLQKIPKKNETKVIKVSHKQFDKDTGKGSDHLKVNFDSFNDLYKLGKQNCENYGMDINTFKFSDIELNNVSPSGQTALGPALAIAAGVVSGYGPGSLVVVITDGRANKGVLSQDGLYEQQIALLRLKLNKSKSETCLIRLQSKSQNKNSEGESCLERYFRKYSSIINISLSKRDPLGDLRKNLSVIIDKSISSKTWTNNIRIKCQNPNVKFDAQSIDRLQKKLFKSHQKQFITPDINQKALSAFDYRHPFMTQVLIEYQNIETKQECKFMAYIIQKFIRYNEMSKKDEESFSSVDTLHNIMNYLEVQGEKLDLKNIPLSMCQQSFRTSIMQSYKCSMQRSFQSEPIVMESFIEPSLSNKQTFKTAKQYIRSMIGKNQEDDSDEDKL